MRFDVLLRKVKKEIPKFEGCIRCGQCCGPLKLSRLEFEKIVKYLNHNNLWELVNQQYESHKILETATGIKSCYFLTFEKDGTSCLIYPARPIVCRLQGLKSNLRCPYNPPQNIKMTKNMMEYYRELSRDGIVLNDEIEKLLMEKNL